MKETRYTAFISYSHEDEKWADWLQRSLESYRVPKHLQGGGPDQGPVTGNLAPVFRDRSELSAAADLGDVIREALTQSSCLLVICSPAAARSRWVNQEILEFKRLGREHRIFCLIVDGEPNTVQLSSPHPEECFPKALRFRLGTDGNLSEIPAEPVAADVRDGKDSKANARLKIVAGMLDVGFDTLKQRDLHRSHQRLAAFAAAATLGIVLTSGLAAYAFRAQNEAETQRELAEDLVEFMVGDMRERLEPIGRLDILDAIGDEVMQYFSSQPPSLANSPMTSRQARALRQIGEIRVQQSRTADGAEVFDQAMALLDEALRRNGNDESLLFEASQLHFWIADAFRREGDSESAEREIEKYLEIAQKLYDLHPENPTYKMEVAYAYNNLGTLAHRSGDAERAKFLFERTLQLQESLAEEYPENLDYEAAMGDTISWMGSLESSRGSLKLALDLYRQELEVRRGVSERSDDPRQDALLASAHRWVGWTLSSLGRFDEAIVSQLEAKIIYASLVEHDPNNFAWAEEYFWTLIELAKDQISLTQLDLARENLSIVDSGLIAFQEDSRDVNFPRLESALMSAFARYHLATNDRLRAARLAHAALERIAPFARAADDYRHLIAYAEAAYLVTVSTGSRDFAMEALEMLDARIDEATELLSMQVLLAFSAGYKDRARGYQSALGRSDFTAPFVPGSDAEEWLKTLEDR